MLQHIKADHNVKLASTQRLGRLNDAHGLLIGREDLLREMNALVSDFIVRDLMPGRRKVNTVEAQTIPETQHLQASAGRSFGQKPADPVTHLKL